MTETENALFEALASIVNDRSLESPMLSATPRTWTSHQDKADRVQEWESVSLSTKDDLRSWYYMRASTSENEEHTVAVNEELSHIPMSGLPRPVASPMPPPTSSGSTRVLSAEAPPSRSDYNSQEGDGDTTVEPKTSKAENLARTRDNIYF